MKHVHVIPVDASFGEGDDAVAEAWREICIFGHRITDTGTEKWGVVCCDGVECAGIEED